MVLTVMCCSCPDCSFEERIAAAMRAAQERALKDALAIQDLRRQHEEVIGVALPRPMQVAAGGRTRESR